VCSTDVERQPERPTLGILNQLGIRSLRSINLGSHAGLSAPYPNITTWLSSLVRSVLLAMSLPFLLSKYEAKLLQSWTDSQIAAGSLRSGQIKENELKDQSKRFLRELVQAIKAGQVDNITRGAWQTTRELLGEFSRLRALQGFSPSETATFVFSLKEPLFALLQQQIKDDPQQLGDELWTATKLLDRLGLYTTEVYQQTRNEIIGRQAQELLELSTPVVELWDKIVALRLIGTLDSERTQTVVENLLNHIVRLGAEIAIIDITGVMTVDTLVAQHLIKTVSAARLMGADWVLGPSSGLPLTGRMCGLPRIPP
jgi:rsbT co-antagonist protein RsbR